MMKKDSNTQRGFRTRHLMIYTFLLILVFLYLASRRERLTQEALQNAEESKKQESVQNTEKKSTSGSGLILDSEEMWSLTLTNESHPLPDDYKPDLKKIPDCEESIDSRAYEPLTKMLEAMKAQGLSPVVCSGFRTKEKQTELFEQEKQRFLAQGKSTDEAYNLAKQRVSVPESGEHRLGLAVDILTPQYPYLEEGFEDTPEGIWLREHAPEYGFILRYDKGKEAVTGIIYEPWHFRYVGKKAAAYMKETNMCMEEFYIAESLYG